MATERRCSFQEVEPGKFLAAWRDLRAFAQWHHELCGAPLKRFHSFVHDTDRREGPAHLTCTAAPGTATRPGAKRRGKCHLDDVLKLNALGEVALQRCKRTVRKGELHKDSVVWRIEDRCQGTFTCDSHRGHACAVRVVYSATIAQVHAGQALIEVVGVSDPDAASLHSTNAKWDPASLRAQFATKQPARIATAKRCAHDLHMTRMELVKRQRQVEGDLPTDEGDDVDNITMADLKFVVSEVQSLQSQVSDEKRSLRQAERATRPAISEEQRREVLRLHSEGHLAVDIQCLLKEAAPAFGFPPSYRVAERGRRGTVRLRV